MLDHPCIAIGARITMPASAAQGERRIATPVQKQQRLLISFNGRTDLRHHLRHQPSALRRRCGAHINQFDLRQTRRAVARRQPMRLIAPIARIDIAFKDGVAVDKITGRISQSGAHHRHITGIIDHPIFLFETAIMLFIDNNQPQIAPRQKQG